MDEFYSVVVFVAMVPLMSFVALGLSLAGPQVLKAGILSRMVRGFLVQGSVEGTISLLAAAQDFSSAGTETVKVI